MTNFLRKYFWTFFTAKKERQRSAYKSKHNQLAKELGTTIRWVE
jgi:hypothetical protein